VEREQWAKCVSGEGAGAVGQVLSIVFPDVVLRVLGGGPMTAEVHRVARLTDQEHWKAEAAKAAGG
jgi:hypothetical protein